MHRLSSACIAAVLLSAPVIHAQTMKAPDITKQPTLYVVPYSHLDTQWRWNFPQTISENLLKTMRQNFYYMDKYPHYVFNWTGSNRYRLMKEYYPQDYERLKRYVAKGQWYPAGASVEEGDVNMPSAESIFRQVLYGNEFYRKEFGKTSKDFMLPDTFGFPASLPTILAHAGILGLSTQKFSADWEPAARVGGPGSPEHTPVGIPFNIGLWRGTDGQTILTAFNPSSYTSHIRYDLSKAPPTVDEKNPQKHQVVDWPSRIALDGSVSGVFADLRYVGAGDVGGATDEESIKLLEAMVTRDKAVLPTVNFGLKGDFTEYGVGSIYTDGPPVTLGDGPVTVISATSDQMFKDIKPFMMTRMPEYRGDLELITHSAGSLTSQAYHKRWNRENEILADAAERASVLASWLSGAPYPQQRLNEAWNLVLSGQFHDSAAGTATPRAFEFTQNDDVIALNQFANVLTNAVQNVASKLDTKTEGVPIVVYNPLNIDRDDLVEAKLTFPGGIPENVAIFSPDGKQIPSQVEGGKVLFVAHVPSVGFAVYSALPSTEFTSEAGLKVTSKSIENAEYIIKLEDSGDIGSIYDKRLKKEILSGPIRLAISTDAPEHYPAWSMEYKQVEATPRAYVGGPVSIRITEQGPVRASIEVTRTTEGSTFVQTVSLSTGGAGDHVEFRDAIDWRDKSANLKVVLPLSATNRDATYNWEVGTVQRPTAYPNQFEVASHYWMDLTDQSQKWGATVLTGYQNGSDKPDDHTLRLTLLRTPGFPQHGSQDYSDQLNQDWGHHDILYGLAGHAGSWQKENTDWQGYRLHSPLLAFQTTAHEGQLGRNFSIVKLNNPAIRILALKKAEFSDAIILRMVELNGETQHNVTVNFASSIATAIETDGQEEPKGAAKLSSGRLETSFTPYQPRTFALHLGKQPVAPRSVVSKPLALEYDLATASNNDTKTIGGFDSRGDALPAEMLPSVIHFDGIDFDLAPPATGKPNAIVPRGQTITLPKGQFNRLYILAAADGDQQAEFLIGNSPMALTIENWTGFIGQWDTREWKPAPASVMKNGRQTPVRQDWAVSANHATWDIDDRGSPDWSPRFPEDYIGLKPGYIKRAPLAWYVSHFHTSDGLNEPYSYSYLFGHSIDLPAGVHSVTLPINSHIRILAMTVANAPPEVFPAQPLYDTLVTEK